MSKAESSSVLSQSLTLACVAGVVELSSLNTNLLGKAFALNQLGEVLLTFQGKVLGQASLGAVEARPLIRFKRF